MVRMHANDMEEINQVEAGDIFALFGIECASGTTFIKNPEKSQLSLSSIFVPDPVLSLSLKPKRRTSTDNLLKALTRFRREDPTFNFNIDVESDELIISGMGELHL